MNADNQAEKEGWNDREAHNRGMAGAVVDLVRSWVEPSHAVCTCVSAALIGLPYDPGCPVHFDTERLGDSEGGRDEGPAMTNPADRNSLNEAVRIIRAASERRRRSARPSRFKIVAGARAEGFAAGLDKAAELVANLRGRLLYDHDGMAEQPGQHVIDEQTIPPGIQGGGDDS